MINPERPSWDTLEFRIAVSRLMTLAYVQMMTALVLRAVVVSLASLAVFIVFVVFMLVMLAIDLRRQQKFRDNP